MSLSQQTITQVAALYLEYLLVFVTKDQWIFIFLILIVFRLKMRCSSDALMRTKTLYFSTQFLPTNQTRTLEEGHDDLHVRSLERNDALL